MNAQRQSLYHMEWQALRVQLLGNWSTKESVQWCYDQLVTYVSLSGYALYTYNGDIEYIERSDDWYITRLYQVVNLLDAVRMGYSGQGMLDTDLDKYFCSRRDIFSEAYHDRGRNYPMATFAVPTVEEIQEDCRLVGRDLSRKILTDLRKRRDFAIRKSAMPTRELKMRSVQQNRPELLWAINAIETSGVV